MTPSILALLLLLGGPAPLGISQEGFAVSPVSVNGSGPYLLVVDTAAGASAVFPDLVFSKDFSAGVTPAITFTAQGQLSASATVRSWMGSEGHRKNVLSTSPQKYGVGVADGPTWVMAYAREC